MSELGERDELSLAHLSFGLLHESALFRGEYVVRVNHAFGLDEHAILLLSECHKVPLLEVEGFEHLPWNHHLAPLANAADPLLGCG
jgi:hypothetical protein